MMNVSKGTSWKSAGKARYLPMREMHTGFEESVSIQSSAAMAELTRLAIITYSV